MTPRFVAVDLGRVSPMWSIEVPTPGVVLLDVAVGKPPSVPLHWRAGTWAKPPLDILLDGEGRFFALQFVLQDERVERRDQPALRKSQAGVPIFDVAEWPEDGFCDEIVPITSVRLSAGELTLRIGEQRHVPHALEVMPRLIMAFTDDMNLAEVQLGPLDEDDWDIIDTFSLVKES